MAASSTRTGKRGIDVLHDPTINKSTGFTEAERQALGLIGLVPDVTETIETQLARVLLQLKEKPSDLERFIHLMNLLETDQTLFYRTLMSDPARFLEIVYDPEIGEASLKFDRIFRRSADNAEQGRFQVLPTLLLIKVVEGARHECLAHSLVISH